MINITDLLAKSYLKVTESIDIICEGGASGHMSHLFEDPDLKFSDLKKIFTQLFKGKLKVEEKCLSPNTVLITEHNGEKTIQDVVDNKINDRVLSYNDITNNIEYANIVDWVKNENTSEWLKITLEDGSTIVCTPNHRIFLTDSGCDIKAEDLIVGNTLLVAN